MTMPVNLTLTVPDIPTPPIGYLVVALEVRAATPVPTLVRYPHSTDGYESAAGEYLRRAVAGQELVAVAWFADRPLTECVDGKERIVSRFDSDCFCWSEWEPEAKTGEPGRANEARSGRWAKRPKLGGGARDLGDQTETGGG